jgi:hypothetical protein
LTREEHKLLGYFSRLDHSDQEIILEILRKSIRLNKAIWSASCIGLIRHLDAAEKMAVETIDMFAD